MADYGAKGSVPGYDVNTVTDYLLQFSSSWPLLKIQTGGSATININGTPQIIYTHNLGYPPLYFVITNGKFDATIGFSGVGVDNNVLAFDGSSSGGGTLSFYYYVCRLPLNQNFTAPVIPQGTIRNAIDHDYGFKVSKPGASIDSDDLRDFALHSSTRSLMIQKIDTGATAFNGLDYSRTVVHELDYVPIGFAYVRYGAGGVGLGHNPNYYYITPPPVGVQDAFYTIDSTKMVITESSASVTAAGDATAVILKDPFFRDTINITLP